MTFIKIPVKGMRDIMPEEMELREYIISEICDTYSLFGFRRIETPCIEHIENISNNQGGENEKLIFKILKRGEKLNVENIEDVDDIVDSGLRYDLTVPLSRYYSNNMNELDKPFKSLQIGNVWRADRPQKGRYRQFIQCDIDMFGEKSNLAEIELIGATSTLLKKLGLSDYQIVINDRRILKAMALYAGFKEEDCDSVFISLDKMDKIGIEGVKGELINNNYDNSIVDKYLCLYNKNTTDVVNFCNQIGNEFLSQDVVNNLKEIIDISVNVNNINIVFDPTLVRGMSYYTGPIFEIKVNDYGSSIGGGGRYDEMIEKYVNVPVPACGFSIGFERLINILQDMNYVIPNKKKKYAYIIESNINENIEIIEKAAELRKQKSIVNIQYKAKNLKHQIDLLQLQGYEVYINNKKIN